MEKIKERHVQMTVVDAILKTTKVTRYLEGNEIFKYIFKL